MAVTFAIDVSHHQDRSLNLADTRRDGCELAILKAGEGNTLVDPDFASNLAEARAAGQLVAAYWYQRSNVTAAAHVAKIRQVVPLNVPIILDVEANSGGLQLTRDIIGQVRAAGYRVPLLYLPIWYWRDHLGSPPLTGLPPLWSSRYPNNVVGTLASEWAEVPASYWNGYGGLSVALLQFTSSARIAGYQPLDASAFRGTRTELAAFLGGQTEENEVQLDDDVVLWDGKSTAKVKNCLASVIGHGTNMDTKITALTGTVNQLTQMVGQIKGVTPDQLAAALAPALLPDLLAAVKEDLADVEHLDENAVADRLAANLAGRLAQ